jgi:hypothetical protein
MPLTVRLDPETERCLCELQQQSGQDKSSLIRELIRERWEQRHPQPSIVSRMGGHPEHFLETLPHGSAERATRRQLLQERLSERRR